jgi:uncharacterized membrane protein YdbT with pleckstrin-like domain
MFILASDLAVVFIISMLFNKGISGLIPGFKGDFLNYVTFFIAGCGILFAAFRQINFLLVRYILTNERIVIQTGFLSRNLTSVKLEHINNTDVRQSFSERLIKTGSIYFFTPNDDASADSTTNALYKLPAFRNIDDPFEIHAKVEQLLEYQQDHRYGHRGYPDIEE